MKIFTGFSCPILFVPKFTQNYNSIQKKIIIKLLKVRNWLEKDQKSENSQKNGHGIPTV